MPIIVLFIIAAISLLIVRAGATAFMMTGLSRDVADFQSVSAFFGVGFTTSEAEMITTHPVRRKIAKHLIIAGNIGLTSALGALMVTLLDNESEWLDRMVDAGGTSALLIRMLAAGIGVGLIFLFFRLGVVRRLFEATIRYTLEHSGAVRAMDYETLLRAHDGYVVSEFEIDPTHPYIGQSLMELGLSRRGVLVLGIYRDSGEYLGTPHKDSTIHAGDVLTVYGREKTIREVLQYTTA